MQSVRASLILIIRITLRKIALITSGTQIPQPPNENLIRAQIFCLIISSSIKVEFLRSDTFCHSFEIAEEILVLKKI